MQTKLFVSKRAAHAFIKTQPIGLVMKEQANGRWTVGLPGKALPAQPSAVKFRSPMGWLQHAASPKDIKKRKDKEKAERMKA